MFALFNNKFCNYNGLQRAFWLKHNPDIEINHFSITEILLYLLLIFLLDLIFYIFSFHDHFS